MARPLAVAPPSPPRPVSTPWGVVAALVALTLGVGTLAVIWQVRAADAAWRDAGNTISAVADLKLQQLEQWRLERLADAQTIQESPNAIRGLEAFVVQRRMSAADAERTRDWMRALARRNRYVRVSLLDRAGHPLVASDQDRHALDADTWAAARAAMADGVTRMGEVHAEAPGGRLRLDVVAPLVSVGPGGVVFGAIVLEVDPGAALLPWLEAWPIPGRSGEVLLLRLVGDEFTFISDTRARPGSALTLRRRMGAMRPEVRDAMQRGGGLVVQEDYRGIPVLAATRRVPGSAWVLTAKLDVAEVRGPLRQRAWLLGALVALVTLGGGAVVVAVWRQRAARHFRELYEGEIERRALEQHYAYLTRFANDIIILTDETGRIVEANERAVETYGYSREELLRLSIGDLRTPETAGQVAEALRLVRDEGGAVFEVAHRRRDGSTFPLEASVRLVEIDGRAFFQGIIRDISERKRHERRIADLNRLYAVLSRVNETIVRAQDRGTLLAETCRVAVEAGALALAWVAWREGDDLVPAASAGADEGYVASLRLTLRADEPRGRGPTPQAIREDRVVTCSDIATDPAMAPWRDAALARGLRSFVALPLRLHGRPAGALCLYAGESRFFDAVEELALLDEVAADLSFALEGLDRRERHLRAEAERARLVTAIEQASEAVLITDLDGTLQYVNPAFERISGHPRADVVGRNPRLLKSGHHDPAFYRGLWSALLRGETWSGRLTNRRRDGGLYEQETTISPIRDATGAVVSFVAVARDVTREVALEAQLRQAQKMEAMGRLAGGVAHDFNNLLTAIIGSAELVLAELGPDSPAAADVDNVRRAARRGADLTRKLLAFSRRQPLLVRPVVLGEVVAEFANLVRRVLREDLEIVVRADPDAPVIAADPGALDQIMMNLVTNARDAIAERGTITIEVTRMRLSRDDCDLLRAGRPGAYAVLAVGDTGAGMSDEVQRHLFEPFYTTKDPGAGTGLGMATVYSLVQEHRGFVQVESAPGAGTVVRVYLPAQASADAAGEAAGVPDEPLPRGTETVLVVEDEDDLRAFARRALERHGYAVVAAADGVEALAVLREEGARVGVVLCDMVMPRMGGPQLERAMREAGIAVPVLFTSGYPARALDEQRLGAEGGAPFLPKPWTVGELLRAVRAVLDAAPTRPARSASP